MRIVFMGTPDFAVPSLRILLNEGYEILAVVTAPDKPGGRQGVQQSAVKRFAMEHGLKTLQPVKLKDPEFIAELRSLKADLQVVVAFRMLPEVVWSMPAMGTMNVHASLLPKYRGAAPINWAIIRGEKETGVSTFLLQHEIDTGDLLFQQKLLIGENETAGEIHDKMMDLGAELLLKSVKALEKGGQKTLPQSDQEATHAPKIFTETCQIDFQKTTEELHNFIRGLSPYPGAWMTWEGKTLKVLKTLKSGERQADVPVGTLAMKGKSELIINTLDGSLSILELQAEGKRRMIAQEFINGHQKLLPQAG
jgi:methionyl-tRNA formyltransferase